MLETTPTLRGRGIDCVPLTIDHAEALAAVTPPDTFPYFLAWPKGCPEVLEVAALREWLAAHIAVQKTRAFAIVQKLTGRIVGSSSYMDIDPKNRAIEIGSTWYAPEVRGT